MTTSQSPLRVLKAQADKIAEKLKAAERGERIEGGTYPEKVEAARAKESIKVAIFMDDKIVSLDLPWSVISATNQAGLSEYILKQMKGARDALH